MSFYPMDWQEFLKQEAGSHGLSAHEEEQTLLAALPSPNQQLSQDQLVNQLIVSKPTIKKRLREIYEKFAISCPEISQIDGAGKLKYLHNYLRQKYYDNGKPIDNYVNVYSCPEQNRLLYPEVIEGLIQEKIENFCGRSFVFEAFKEFLNKYSKGYFTIVGYPGMGKTTIAAKYASDNREASICYFNLDKDGWNQPKKFLYIIRQQIKNRYNLIDVENDDLRTLLTKASKKLKNDQKLVIIVDALDEVRQPLTGENILYLPTTLPDKVYFLLTRQPYNLSTRRLFINPGVPDKELNLNDSYYNELHQRDIRDYLESYIDKNNFHESKLNKWMNNYQIDTNEFINRLSDRSEKIFIYLTNLIAAIDDDDDGYDDAKFIKSPKKLTLYYQNHWHIMGMNNDPSKLMEKVLYILTRGKLFIFLENICEILNEDEFKIERILNRWIGYLLVKADSGGNKYYSIYHHNFLDFIKQKPEMSPKRKEFQDINNWMLTKEMEN